MLSSGKDYRKLYQLQDKFLQWWPHMGLHFGLIDTPLNILSNKLSALISRDMPKDVFDIMHIALNFSFNWTEIFNDAKQKAVINEIDVEQRLIEFPVQTLQNISILENQPEMNLYPKVLETIANDFLLGSDNSLGAVKPSLIIAEPVFAL